MAIGRDGETTIRYSGSQDEPVLEYVGMAKAAKPGKPQVHNIPTAPDADGRLDDVHLDRVVVKDLTFDVRPGTSDRQSIKEVVEQHSYTRKYFPIEPGERWLDLGVNAGAFSVFAASHGARVIGYEPEPYNLRVAERNVAINGLDLQVDLHPEAVVHDAFDGDTASLFLSNTPYGQWRHSLLKTNFKQAMPVPVVRISALLHEYQPDAAKMDIEGAEMDILEQLDDWQSVKKLVFEWHFDVDRSVARYRAVVERLSAFFPTVKAPSIPADVTEYTFFPPAKIVYCFGRQP